MRTTQQAFHTMRGHVADGCQVLMENGDTLTIKADPRGWQIWNGDRRHASPTAAAFEIECLIVAYPQNTDMGRTR